MLAKKKMNIDISLILFCVGLPLLYGIAWYIHAKTKLKQSKDQDKEKRQKAREKKMKELFDYDPK